MTRRMDIAAALVGLTLTTSAVARDDHAKASAGYDITIFYSVGTSHTGYDTAAALVSGSYTWTGTPPPADFSGAASASSGWNYGPRTVHLGASASVNSEPPYGGGPNWNEASGGATWTDTVSVTGLSGAVSFSTMRLNFSYSGAITRDATSGAHHEFLVSAGGLYWNFNSATGVTGPYSGTLSVDIPFSRFNFIGANTYRINWGFYLQAYANGPHGASDITVDGTYNGYEVVGASGPYAVTYGVEPVSEPAGLILVGVAGLAAWARLRTGTRRRAD